MPLRRPCFCFISSLVSNRLGDSTLYWPLTLHRDMIHWRIEAPLSSETDYSKTHGSLCCCTIDTLLVFSLPLLSYLFLCLHHRHLFLLLLSSPFFSLLLLFFPFLFFFSSSSSSSLFSSSFGSKGSNRRIQRSLRQ